MTSAPADTLMPNKPNWWYYSPWTHILGNYHKLWSDTEMDYRNKPKETIQLILCFLISVQHTWNIFHNFITSNIHFCRQNSKVKHNGVDHPVIIIFLRVSRHERITKSAIERVKRRWWWLYLTSGWWNGNWCEKRKTIWRCEFPERNRLNGCAPVFWLLFSFTAAFRQLK